MSFTLAFAALSALLLFSSNSLYVRLGYNASFRVAAFIIVDVLILALWASRSIRVEVLQRWLGWLFALVFVWLSIQIFGGDSKSVEAVTFFALLAVAPLFLHLVKTAGMLDLLFLTFVRITCLLASLSLLAWLVGPFLGLASQNCSILTNWGTQGLWKEVGGWFHLTYAVQYTHDFGLEIWRNTSIFVEAPMYSYVLSIALLVEVSSSYKTSLLRVLVLATSIVSTVSTTGLSCLLLIALFSYYSWMKVNDESRAIKGVFFALVLVLLVLVLYSLTAEKLGSMSGSTRLDDYSRGLAAWSRNYVFGNGLSNYSVIQDYMSGFRSDNAGFSSCLVEVLYKGGIAFMLPFAISFFGYLRSPSTVPKLAALYIFFLLLVTIVTFLPLTAFLVSYGVELALTGGEVDAVRGSGTHADNVGSSSFDASTDCA